MNYLRCPAWLVVGRRTSQALQVNDFFFEGPLEQGVMVRVPKGRLPEGTTFLCVTLVVDPSGGAQKFIDFLRDVVRRSPDGRVSRPKLWSAWAVRHDAEPSIREIAGVHWKDVPELFRIAFDADDLVRKRLDGESSRVWYGYELVPDDDGPPNDSTD